ncbi:MAG: hypothetical protein HZB46_00900 [Solirubrobacterales bacterium]|nr:hypothetical protein [Solirubrobacterales bacterium]
MYTSYSNDTINGGAGNDTIRGYSGDDKITGGPGQDTIFGDTQGQTCMFLSCSTYIGNDVIDARDGERDSIDCGLGTDTALVDAIDVTTGCEDVQVAATPAAPGGGQQTTTTTTTPTTTTTTTAKPGARACATPKGLKGLTSTKAKARVRKAACKVKTRSVRSKKVKKGRVVKVARKGSTVTIYVSKGR